MRKLIIIQIFAALVINIAGIALLAGCTKTRKADTLLKETHQKADKPKKVPARPEELREDAALFEFAEEPKAAQELDYVVVQFEFDSYELTNEQKELINLMDVDDCGIELVGGACPIGTEGYNLQLGMRRALVVYDYLVNERGAKNVRWRSVGEHELRTTNPDEYYLNRRCDIIMER